MEMKKGGGEGKREMEKGDGEGRREMVKEDGEGDWRWRREIWMRGSLPRK